MKLSDIIEKPCSGEWGTDDESGKGIPVLRTTNFTNEGIINYSNVCTRTIDKTKAAKKFLRQGDIIIEKSGGSDKQPVGRVVYFEGENDKYLYNNFTAALRVKDRNKWECKYVFYALFCCHLCGKTRMYQNKTTGLHNLQLTDYINDVIIPDNPLAIQREIAYNLDKVSEAIEQCRKILEKLDYLVKAKFAEMFGDPITNPMRWETKEVQSVCNKIYGGGTPSKFHPEYFEGNIPWVTPKDMKDSVIRDSIDHITEEAVNNSTAKIVPAYSILMVIRSGILKHTLPVAMNVIDVTINQDMKAFVTNGQILPQYLLYLFKLIEPDVLQGVRAVTADNIDFNDFKVRKIPVPPLPLQEQFAEYVQKTDRAKAAVKKTLEKAQVLKAALMQKYFG